MRKFHSAAYDTAVGSFDGPHMAEQHSLVEIVP
jgi:hypothetical protein